ncbi:galactokinase/galacturonokinase [Natranaerovirga pectinivora]|uniref:Galactokinase/galacturonokinase n=1 Tax=Natranaerovirga pectinivora TaxID=682400 RepID=A0A4R3MLS4_9FIRM|nr:galactokinase family protein [Natranaerovirga pectinivora]TCT12849.1 galactokinase/galacturonokinase [Natranaerovirga pectinivora]
MKSVETVFQEKYSSQPIHIVKSPLRICPLGAHVDHQHGLVTGMAIDASINMAYSSNKDGYIRVQSIDFPDEEIFHIKHVPDMIPGHWGNYLRGAVLALEEKNILHCGIDAVISGKLPIGGLSSSAAVTTAYLLALCDANNIQATKEELIEYSHWVETEFIGLNNGILDQAANILSEDGYLMSMDCSTGEYKLTPKPDNMPEFEVAVVYSGVSKALIGTDYNNRVDECKVAACILEELACGTMSPIKEIRLRDVDDELYQKYREELPGRFRRRADHFYTENQRVKDGIEAWEKGDIEAFGKLMFESGESSIHNYESGCPELTTIYNILKDCPGVYGARFSGAGYRGCCIAIINPEFKDEIRKRVDAVYPVMHPEYADVYKVNFCKTDDGARIIPNYDANTEVS